MSTQLPAIDLSTAMVGSTGTIDLSKCAPTSHPAYTLKPALLQIYNESGAGLRLSYRESGGGADIAAGVWKNLIIPAGEHFVDYVVQYVLPAARVNTLLATYYQPNETADAVGTLGNSPGTVANQVGTGLSWNLVLETQTALNMPFPTANQTFALTAQHRNIAGVSASKPGYLVLNYIICQDQNLLRKNTHINKEVASQQFNLTIPGSVTGNVQTVLFAPANYMKGMVCFCAAGITLTRLRVKRSQDAVGAYYDLLIAAQGPNTTVFYDIGSRFDGADGFTNLVSQASNSGFSLEVTTNNTNVGATGFNIQVTGSVMAFDEVLWSITYQDWQNNLYDFGLIRHGQDIIIPLNMLIPIAITDSTQTNFGSLVFENFGSQLYYDTVDTWQFFMPATLTFLAP